MRSASLICGDCVEAMRSMPDQSIHSVVTDPPYGLTANKKGGTGDASMNLDSPAGRSRVGTGGGFMGLGWDASLPSREVWEECFRVLKPGGHLLAFFGARTYHRGVCTVEDAGFEIRDQIMWVFGSGFPKSLNLDGPWDGWGTGLKPAHEPIVLARKPLKGTVAQNVDRDGVGALNIDGCRVAGAVGSGVWGSSCANAPPRRTFNASPGAKEYTSAPVDVGGNRVGRWPTNLIHDGSDEVVDLMPAEAGAAGAVYRRNGDKFRNAYGAFAGDVDEEGSTFRGDSVSAARFFYCAKASASDRGAGNAHPTVKPTSLMRYLCRLVTPPGGVVLDPFMGSGSTGVAAIEEGFQFFGIEREPGYYNIAQRRVRSAQPPLPAGEEKS
jgi:site-specific DNA-methyltransferase (adenine-specific)